MRGAVFIAVLVLLMPVKAEALKISPFKLSLHSSESETVRVENNSPEPAAVQVSVLTWDIDEHGNEINKDAESDFVVFPAQLILQPHESRAVRVQYLGETPLREKPYRLVAEQLPVSLKGTLAAGSAVRFLLKFKAALYVAVGKVENKIRVERIEPDAGGLRLKLVNEGSGHSLLRAPSLNISYASGRTETIGPEKLKAIDGENIHAGKSRSFVLPFTGAESEIASAEIKFDPAF